jgi:hypothetical protein
MTAGAGRGSGKAIRRSAFQSARPAAGSIDGDVREKRVPATVEFWFCGGWASRRGAGMVDMLAYKNADALVHMLRAFQDRRSIRQDRSIRPRRQAMEDELLLADLGVSSVGSSDSRRT